MTAPVKDVVEAVREMVEKLQRVSNLSSSWMQMHNTMTEAATILESLATQVASMEAMKKDAERYRWLRKAPIRRHREEFYSRVCWVCCENGAELDASIDRLMIDPAVKSEDDSALAGERQSEEDHDL